jgi:hypothetical protein
MLVVSFKTHLNGLLWVDFESKTTKQALIVIEIGFYFVFIVKGDYGGKIL